MDIGLDYSWTLIICVTYKPFMLSVFMLNAIMLSVMEALPDW